MSTNVGLGWAAANGGGLPANDSGLAARFVAATRATRPEAWKSVESLKAACRNVANSERQRIASAIEIFAR